MAKLALLFLSSALLFACGPRVSASGDGGPGDGGAVVDAAHVLTAIEVTPTNPILELDLGQTGSQPFLVTGRYADGVDEDLTTRVTFTVSNPAVGTMNGATLEIPAFNAVSVNVARIAATLDGITGEAQITVVAYRRTGAQQDFFFILPYMDPTGEQQKPLAFGTAVPALDVFFLMDTTGSMGDEIGNLRNSLTGTVLPGISGQVANSQFGVGAFEDYPLAPYGTADCDQPFRLFQTITNNTTNVASATGQLLNGGGGPRGCGNDTPESGIEALYQVATGAGRAAPTPTNVPPSTAGIGGVGFRAGAMPVVVTITDALFHGPGEPAMCGIEPANYGDPVASNTATRGEAKTALNAICARSVGVASSAAGNTADTCTGLADLEDFARATGARVPPAAWDFNNNRPVGCAAGQCCTGANGAGRPTDGDGLCPLVFLTDSSGNGLGNSIVTGIQMLTRFATFDVTSERVGVGTSVGGAALPAGRTTADFIKAVVPTSFMLPPPPPALPNPTFDATTFRGVTPGTTVRFNVRALNDFVPQTAAAQVFRATIRVLAGGCTPLDAREVLILVPPDPIVIQ